MGLDTRARNGELVADLISARERGTLIECLDDGFVKRVDYMGNDGAIVQAARVSYGAGTKSVSDDRALIRYLMRHRHTTPLEMVEFKFLIRMPMDAWRQHIRHRTASVNEYSTRYSEAIDARQATPAGGWREQATTNKQGSGGALSDWPNGFSISDHTFAGGTIGQYLSHREVKLHELATSVYQERLGAGVAREQARKDLPLSTYTEAYWKIDLHNLFHFLGLRLAPDAQLEIRQYANAIAALVKPIVPLAWEAFEDFRLNAMFLSGPEIEAIKSHFAGRAAPLPADSLSQREEAELKAKLGRLGIAGVV